ncbi:hypothetical protein OIU74_029544 [Salix koriyanagi]|uniref:non-specific serine/threonine protein kinase n=1 Tax=Salix koriyanagi TaxID=2511006 RepID=A0A9Q0VE66_9ROSI|nr:hypothetical protein OIU74_029544 [Salix koriyanagi]
MGLCWSNRIKSYTSSFSSSHTGLNSKYGSRDGKGLSSSSSKEVSLVSVPQTPRSECEILQSSNLKTFTFRELKTATRNFRPDSVLGEGGFGSVFKGWVDEHSLSATRPGAGMVIAVKRLNQQGFQGHREWLAEINYLGQFQHPNLVKLIGYCLEDDNRLLVYEFMPRGSMENHLFRSELSMQFILPATFDVSVLLRAALSHAHCTLFVIRYGSINSIQKQEGLSSSHFPGIFE